MKTRLLILLLLYSVYCFGQNEYIYYSSREQVTATMTDSTLHGPAGAEPSLRSGSTRAGAFFIDTVGGGRGLWFYDGIWKHVLDSANAGLFGRTDARNYSGLSSYFSNAGNNFTIDSSRLFSLRADTFTLMGGNVGFKTTAPTNTLTIGDDISGNATLFMYAPNGTAAFVKSKSGADLGIVGGGKLYLTPNGYTLSGQVVYDPTPTGYIKQSFYASGGSIVGNVGIDSYSGSENQFFIEPVNVGGNTTYLNLRNSILTPNIALITDSTGFDVYMMRRSDGAMRRIPSNLIGGSGGGGSGTLTNFIFTDGNGFDGTVINSTTTPTLSLTTTVTNQQVLTSNSGAISGSSQFTFTGQALQLASTNTTQTTTSSALSQAYNSLTTGTGHYLASSSLTSGKAMDIQVSGTAGATGQVGLNIALTGNNASSSQTTYAARFSNSHGGTTPVNYSLYTDAGLVGFNTPTLDANHTVIVKGPDNSTNHGLKVTSNNESFSATMAWNGFTASGDMTLTANSGNITTSVLSTKGVGIGGTPTSTLSVLGSLSVNYRSINALRTLDRTDGVVEITANTFTVTLPTAVGITGRIYEITNSGTGVTTLSTTGAETFVNVTGTPTTLTLNQFNSVRVVSNGANWLRTNAL